MGGLEKQMQRPGPAGGLFSFARKRKSWWLLPLAVLFLLLGVLYLLGHLSSADPETYPTTRQTNSAGRIVC